MTQRTIFLLTFSLFIPALIVFAADSTDAIHYFPGRKVFPEFLADGRAHQFSLSRVTENREWISAVGGTIPMLEARFAGGTVQTGIAATIFNRLIKTPGHLTVYTVDYRVDVPLDMRFSEIAFRLAVGHISCHFADDAIELLGEKSIQHVNDYILLAGAYDVRSLGGHLYGSIYYSYGTQPVRNKPWTLQIGADAGEISLHKEVSLYGAIDLKVREEVGWGSTRSFQLGAKLFPRGQYRLRIAYTLRMGYEERGQFYLNRTTLNLISAFIDF
jgi:hypothetical protein